VPLRSAGAVVPDGIGLVEVRGGMCAPDPATDPEPEEAGGEGATLPLPPVPPDCGCVVGVPGLVR
jgi:hypothetical protein